MKDSEKLKQIKSCFQEFYKDVDEKGAPLDNITRHDVFDSIEEIVFNW